MPSIDTGRLCLNYEVAGLSGPPVLLVHELGGSCRSWHRVVALLEDRYRIFAPDLRGHGLSEKPPGRCEVQDYALDLAAFMETMGAGQVHVCGTAFGAIVAAALASIRPDLVACLVCLDGTDAITPEAGRYIYERSKTVRASGMRVVVETSLGNSFPDAFGDLRAAYRPSFLANDPVSYAEASEALCRMDIDYSRITSSTLVANGALDFIWPPAAGRRLAERIAGARFEVLEAAGHFPHIQTPEESARMIREFLESPEG